MRHKVWTQWVTGEGAQTLLCRLCEAVEDPATTKEDLVAVVQGFERQAFAAVGAQDFTRPFAADTGVTVDRWMFTC